MFILTLIDLEGRSTDLRLIFIWNDARWRRLDQVLPSAERNARGCVRSGRVAGTLRRGLCLAVRAVSSGMVAVGIKCRHWVLRSSLDNASCQDVPLSATVFMFIARNIFQTRSIRFLCCPPRTPHAATTEIRTMMCVFRMRLSMVVQLSIGWNQDYTFADFSSFVSISACQILQTDRQTSERHF